MSSKRSMKKEDVMKVVLIGDLYDVKYSPFNGDAAAFWPIATIPAILLSLACLHARSSIRHVIVITKASSDAIRCLLRSCLFANDMTIETLDAPSSSCVGDALRELYSKNILDSDFIVIDCIYLSRVNLSRIFEQFKAIKKKEKNAVGAVCFARRSCDPNLPADENELSVTVDDSQKIVFFKKHQGDISVFSPETFSNKSKNYTDLVECHLCVFTDHLLSTFADNFDYVDISDGIRGTLVDEEISSNSIYAIILDMDERHIPIVNLSDYMQANFAFLNRNFYPLTPENFSRFESKLSQSFFAQLSYYETQPQVFKGCSSLHGSVLAGKDCRVGNKCRLENVILGEHCTVGSQVTLRNCVIWPNVIIGDRCEITYSIIGREAKIGKDASIPELCVIGCGVLIPDCTALQRKTVVVRSPQSGLGLASPVVSPSSPDGAVFNIWGEAIQSSEDEVSDDDALSQDDDARMGDNAGVPNEDEYDFLDKNVIFNEIFRTIERGVREDLEVDQLVLEINGLKHAYNVPIRDLIEDIVESVFRLPINSRKQYPESLKSMFPKLEEFVKKYARDEDTQVHFIYALETAALKYEEVGSSLLLIFTMLYERDVVEEPAIMRYYRNPLLMPEADQIAKIEELRRKIAPFLHWLQTAEVESE